MSFFRVFRVSVVPSGQDPHRTMTLSFQLGSTLGPTDEVWSVSRLTQMVKRLVEGEMPAAVDPGRGGAVQGLVAAGIGTSTCATGNCQVRCCMWSRDIPRAGDPAQGRDRGLRPRQAGDLRGQGRVPAQASPGSCPPPTIGAAQQELERVRALLQRDGLFDPRGSGRSPSCASTVAVVTSVAGAALRDIITVVRQPVALLPARSW